MNTNTATATPANRVNGVDVDQVTQVIESIQTDADIAKFQFRARNQWVDGALNRSELQDYTGANAEHTREQPFTLDNDEPPLLDGDDSAPNPVEYVLHALAGCVTTTTVLHAAARGIQIESLSTELVGTIDVQGLLALDDAVPVGYEHIQIKMDIKADCSDKELDDLLAFAKDHSPVCNTICRPVPVTVKRVQ